MKYVSGFEKGDHFALIVEFELVVLCKAQLMASLLRFGVV